VAPSRLQAEVRAAPEASHVTNLRKHREARVDDTFGTRTVIATHARDQRGHSNERVTWRCVCGAVGDSFVFNMRGRSIVCRHKGRSDAPLPPSRDEDRCICGESWGDHLPGGGACLEDDCECLGFRDAGP